MVCAIDTASGRHGHTYRRLLLAATAICLVPLAATAQDVAPEAVEETAQAEETARPVPPNAAAAGEPSVQLEPITVTTESPTGPVVGYVARRTVTGSKTDTPILEVPQSVSVVTRDQMDARAVQNVGEALDYSAGVVAGPFGTDPRFDAPIIRGFSAADSQYLNGLKLIREQGMVSIEPYGLERIDVLRGPSSVLYGQGNPGGLINLVSKRPVFQSFGEVNGQAATFDRYTGAFDVGGAVGASPETANWAYRLTGLVRNGGTQMDYVDDDRYFIAPTVTWRPTDATTLTLLASLQYDESDSPVGLPAEYTVLKPASRRLSRSLYLGSPDFDSSNRTFSNLGYEFSHEFDNGMAFRQNARYTQLNWDYQNLYFNGLDAADPAIANRGSSYNDEDLGTFTMDNQFEAAFDTAGLSHTVLAGLDIRRHHTDTLTEFGTAPSINVFHPRYGQRIDRSIWYDSHEDGTLTQVGLYGQDQVRLDKWLLTLGLRHDWASTEATTKSNYGDSRQDQDDSAFTGRIGLTYLFDNGLAPYASYSTSFEPVIGNMPAVLGGGAFKPSEGEQIELGVKYQPVGWNAFLTGAVYDLTQTNVTSTRLIDGVSYTVQNGEVKVRGGELSAVASLADGLNLIMNYTYMDAEITKGANSGNEPANVPKHSANAWLDYTLQSGALEGLGAGAGVRYVGERYNLDTNTIRLSANTLVDAALHYERGALKASLNVNNIADVNYVSSCGYFGCYYGDGRTVIGQLTVKW